MATRRTFLKAGGLLGARLVLSDLSGSCVWHCHILDHEDNEMMLRYTVT